MSIATIVAVAAPFMFFAGGRTTDQLPAQTRCIRVGDYTLAYYRAPEHASPPTNFLDPYDSFEKDANGDLLIAANGTVRFSTFMGAEFKGYVLKTKKGSPIIVYQTSPTRRWRHKSNCHGFTFLDGDYWLLSDQVDQILKDNNWAVVGEEAAHPGDVAIYRDLGGKIVHSAKVVGRDPEGHVLVDSKNGYDQEIKAVWAEAVVPFNVGE